MTRFVFGAVVALALGLGAAAAEAQQVSVNVEVTVTGGLSSGNLGVPTLGAGPVLITCWIYGSPYSRSFWRLFPVASGTPCFVDEPTRFGTVRYYGYTS